MNNIGDLFGWFIGVVVDVNDPHKSGRVRIRVHGMHDDKTNIPDATLPWSLVMQPVTSAAIGKIGTSPVGLVKGSTIMGLWLDKDQQYPLVIGTIGKSGDPLANQSEGGAPKINTAVGSIPAAARGNPTNPYSKANGSPVFTIPRVDMGYDSINSVDDNKGIIITNAVRQSMRFATVPTTASFDKNNNSDVMTVISLVDPFGIGSSLPCLNFSYLSLQKLLAVASSVVTGVVKGLAQAISAALINAILMLAEKYGLLKILNILNTAAMTITEFQNLFNALNTTTCGKNDINQKNTNPANQAFASAINGLNLSSGYIVGGLNTLLNTANLIPILAPSFSVKTANSKVPDNIVSVVPPNYIRKYYSNSDPTPGFIQWTDDNGNSVYTARGTEPNYISSDQHIQFAAQSYIVSQLEVSIISGKLSGEQLTSMATNTLLYTQNFALASVVASGFSTPSLIFLAAATIIPVIIPIVNAVFLPTIENSLLPNIHKATDSVNKFITAQTILAKQRSSMQTALTQKAS